MRVVLFTDSYPPLVDGVARTLARLVRTMDACGVAVRVVTPQAAAEADERVLTVASLRLALYDYYRVGLPYFQGVEHRLAAWRPDLVHLANPTPLNLFGAAWARRAGIPAVSSYHTHFVSYFRYYGLKGAERLGWRYLTWFHNLTACTFAPSPSAARELAARGVHRVELWERGIDLSAFSPEHRDVQLRARAGARPGRPLLLFVGRLVREKDLDDLVAAHHRLRAAGYDYALVLVGDGPMYADLAARLPEAVFTGTVSGELLHRWFASADIFVFPSTTETFGNVVLEAGASGLPSVVVASGGPADIVRDGVTGLVARPNDPDHLVAQIRRLLDDPALARRMGATAREVVRSRSWETINRGLLQRYRAIIAEHRAHGAAA